jgi:hypothetical protein
VSKRANVEIPPCGCEAPGANAAATCYCGVDDLLRVIRRRYSLAAMNAIHSRGTARYHDIAAALTGVSIPSLRRDRNCSTDCADSSTTSTEPGTSADRSDLAVPRSNGVASRVAQRA